MIIDQQLTVNSHLISLRVDNDVGINIYSSNCHFFAIDGWIQACAPHRIHKKLN